MYYAHTDHLGSLRLLTADDVNKSIVSRYHFDPWGKRTHVFDTNITNRGFTMHEHLDDVGLINCNARLYDPVLARFLSPDTYVADVTYSQDFNRYSYARNSPLIYTDPTGEIAWLIPAVKMVASIYLSGVQSNVGYCYQNGTNPLNPGNWNWKSPNTYVNMANSAGLLPNLNVPGAIPNGALHAGGQVALNGIGNLISGDNFFNNWGWSAGMGFVSGGYSGFQLANARGLNPWTGLIPLETKLEILFNANYAELMSEIGEAGVSDVYLGNRKNLAGTGFKNSGGDLLDIRDGRVANGFLEQGRYYDRTFDGYNKLNNNNIYLSKNTVRRMWRGNLDARETLFHEWFHARDFYTGWADFFFKQYGSNNFSNMLEIRAHSFNYSRYPTKNRLLLLEQHATRFLNLLK